MALARTNATFRPTQTKGSPARRGLALAFRLIADAGRERLEKTAESGQLDGRPDPAAGDEPTARPDSQK